MNVPTLHCKRCGHSWIPRSDNPQKCPKCCSYQWNMPKESNGEKTKNTSKVEHIMVSEVKDEKIDYKKLINKKLGI